MIRDRQENDKKQTERMGQKAGKDKETDRQRMIRGQKLVRNNRHEIKRQTKNDKRQTDKE